MTLKLTEKGTEKGGKKSALYECYSRGLFLAG